MFRTIVCSVAIVGLAAGMASSAGAGPVVTLIETIEPAQPPDFDGWGRYTLIAGDLEGNVIVGFAVDNSVSEFAYTDRPGWWGDVVHRLSWDAGYPIHFNRLWMGLSQETMSGGNGPHGVGSLDKLMPMIPGNQVNLYWLAFDDGVPIVSSETEDRFFYEPAAEESVLLLFCKRPMAESSWCRPGRRPRFRSQQRSRSSRPGWRFSRPGCAAVHARTPERRLYRLESVSRQASAWRADARWTMRA